jgi:hypothetical protein
MQKVIQVGVRSVHLKGQPFRTQRTDILLVLSASDHALRSIEGEWCHRQDRLFGIEPGGEFCSTISMEEKSTA